MSQYDVFNGDADGMCALRQLHLARPRRSILVTGLKRDVGLLKHVNAGVGDSVDVLDVSIEPNRHDLIRLLESGAVVTYYDHHAAADLPRHPSLTTHLDDSSRTCTSLIVDKALRGAHREWAVVGAFGDNCVDAARAAAASLGLGERAVGALRRLGVCINYNGYGEEVADLLLSPESLFAELSQCDRPLDFVSSDTWRTLWDGYNADMTKALAMEPDLVSPSYAMYILPAERWAARVIGSLANSLAEGAPGRAHAVLRRRTDGGFLVSVRAPLARPAGADGLCRGFETGGGRSSAAGINRLPDAEFRRFVAAFAAAFGTTR